MQEFSSVTASSYDADSLTPMLNDKAAEGWGVVSIVSAGTNIVAYLSRDAGQLDAIEEAAVEVVAEEVAVEEAAAEVAVEAAIVEEAAAEVAATEEPAGWASAPESDTTAPADDSIASLAAQVAEPVPVLAADPEPAVVEPVVAEPVAAEPVVAAEPAVPAGWYADPSGRFELRYWDGGAWTEHVSRAGQQFTDPPVA
jgi:hypothetical protein